MLVVWEKSVMFFRNGYSKYCTYSFWETKRITNLVIPAETGLSDSFLSAMRKKRYSLPEHVLWEK